MDTKHRKVAEDLIDFLDKVEFAEDFRFLGMDYSDELDAVVDVLENNPARITGYLEGVIGSADEETARYAKDVLKSINETL